MEFFEFIKVLLSATPISTEITKPTPVCPNCEVSLESQAIDEHSFGRCSTCHGLWLSEDVFGVLLDLPEEKVASLTGQFTAEHTLERSPQSRPCANCENAMDNYQFNYDSGIWLDACPGNHGIWLDEGELKLCRACKRFVDKKLATGGPSAGELLHDASTSTGDLEHVRGKLEG